MLLIRYFILLFLLACTASVVRGQKGVPQVLAVYPSSDTLPENLLRFYVQFSRPMKAVDNLEHIHLLNAAGEVIEGAIFNNVYELWDDQQMQLTLLLDPSRVKTGLQAHENLGRALEPGQSYRLVIGQAADVDGNAIAAPYVKTFFVSEADFKSPAVEAWQVEAPKAGGRGTLRLDFPQVLDRMSLCHRICILNPAGEPVLGKIELGAAEQSWTFRPTRKWKRGTYTIQVNGRLEDPAGNNLNGLFDHAIGSLNSAVEGALRELQVELW